MLQKSHDQITKFIRDSQYITDIDELTRDLFQTTQGFGIHQGHFIRYTKNGPYLEVVKITGSRNDAFSRRYERENLSRIDPFIRRAATYLTPFTWQQVALDEADNEDTQYFIQTCKDHGMADGIVIPSHSNDGTLGIVTFKGKGVSTDYELHPYLHQLGVYYRAGIKRIEEMQEPKLDGSVLTPRQLQCIQWIAAGKSDWEIAEILGLSQFTVNRHVELAKQRLGFSSRIQVVVHALTAGLIAI